MYFYPQIMLEIVVECLVESYLIVAWFIICTRSICVYMSPIYCIYILYVIAYEACLHFEIPFRYLKFTL